MKYTIIILSIALVSCTGQYQDPYVEYIERVIEHNNTKIITVYQPPADESWDCLMLEGKCIINCGTRYDISIDRTAQKQFHDYYVDTKENEYAVCVIGTVQGTQVKITGMDQFVIGTPSSVQAASCNKAHYLGMLHKHDGPLPRSYPSMNDVLRMNTDWKTHHNPFSFIQFSPTEISIKTAACDDWYHGRTYHMEAVS